MTIWMSYSICYIYIICVYVSVYVYVCVTMLCSFAVMPKITCTFFKKLNSNKLIPQDNQDHGGK